MNKYSYIAILAAILIGVMGGSFFTNKQYKTKLEKSNVEYRKTLEKQNKNSVSKIKDLNQILLKKDGVLRADSMMISQLEGKVIQLQEKVKKKRETVKVITATPSAKEDWLNERYGHLIQVKPDSITLSDTVGAMVIDELVVKDGLIEENTLKDSIISGYESKDSTYKEVIQTHETKDIYQDSIITNQVKINQSLIEDNKETKRELKKEKIKAVFNKVIIIGEAILIIALII